MRWKEKARMSLQMLFRRGHASRRLDAELQFHLEQQIAENLATGMNPEEARAAALRAFGNPAALRDQARDTWSWNWLETLARDFRYALRQMRRSSGFAIAVIGTLAVGIAAAAAMFTVVDHVLLQPVPYRDPGRLVAIHEGDGSQFYGGASWKDIEQWEQQSHTLHDFAFSGGAFSGGQYLITKHAALEVYAVSVTSNLFHVLGVQPALGRGFLPQKPSFSPGRNTGSIILSNAVWKSEFNSDPHILGHTVKINNSSWTVIGVMPPQFSYPAGDSQAQVWVPAQLGKTDRGPRGPANVWTVMARLRPGVNLRAAQTEMAAIQKRVAAGYTSSYTKQNYGQIRVQRYADSLVGIDTRKALLALLAAAGLLWLIAGVNATNLMLARSTARQREIATRGALGASRRRVVQQMLMEGFVLSLAAGALGIGLAFASVRLLAHEISQQLPLPVPATPNARIVLALLGLTLLTALLAAAWPAWIAARTAIEPSLRQGGVRAGTGRRHHRIRGVLVASEVAMSLTLLVACGLFLRTLYSLRHVPLGYRTDHILVAHLSIPSFRYAGHNMTTDLYEPILERVQHLHGVSSAGLTSEVPLGDTFSVRLTLRRDKSHSAVAAFKGDTPGIHQVFGLHMLAGRYFSAQDTATSQPVIVVNQAFARAYSPKLHDPSAILGTALMATRRNAKKGQGARIVGVLANTHQESLEEKSAPEIDLCIPQLTPDSTFYQVMDGIAMDLAVRTSLPTAQMIPELRDVLRQASPELANSTIVTMDQIVADSYGSQRMAAHLLEFFGGMALLLCVAGLYGLLAYVVSQRTRELGVRIALGAQRSALMWMVLRQAAVMLLAGVLAGTGLAWASARLIRGFLYGVKAHDAWTLAAAAILLLLCGLLSAWLPARRAAAVDPLEALRAE